MMPASEFVARQNDFRARGCTNRWPEIGSPGDKPTWFGCDKPPPYNWFDWTDDGCSVPRGPWPRKMLRRVFEAPCRQHDFGYRNFGKGLTLRRNEARRKLIDEHFLAEMHRICDDPKGREPFTGPRRGNCRNAASTMFQVVRRHPDNNWRKPAKPQPSVPLPPEPSVYRGHIVQWSGDTKPQKTAWLVGPDLKRRHIPSAAVYNCLKAKGHPGPTALLAWVLDRLPDLGGVQAECGAPTRTPTPTQQPLRKVITVYNKLTNGGAQMREDPIPVRLTTEPWKNCGSRGCNINGTERSTGQRYDAASCWTTGDLTTNGDNTSSVDDQNPNLYSSNRYYKVRLTNGTTGYVSWVWIQASHRGGLGLPGC